jgi:hypothetical protein
MKKSTKKWLIILSIVIVIIWGIISLFSVLLKVKAPYRYEEGRLMHRYPVLAEAKIARYSAKNI